MKILSESAYNHNGNLQTLKKLATHSRELNVDYFTCQVMNVNEFCTEDYSKKDIYKDMEFTQEQWLDFFTHCKELKLDVIPCVLDKASFLMCYKYGYRLVKIHGTDLTNKPFLELIREHKCSVILETQCSTLIEIEMAIEILGDLIEAIFGGYSNYPTEIEDFNINSIETLKVYGYKVGYADHSRDTTNMPLMLLSKGYDYIEKHITCTRNNRNYDWEVSLYPDEFRVMISNLSHYTKALGNSCKHPSKNEMKFRPTIYKKIVDKSGIMKRSNSGNYFIDDLIEGLDKNIVAAPIIARLSSQRLTRKVLLKFHTKTVIEDLYTRLSKSDKFRVNIATSYLSSDNELALLFKDKNIFRHNPESIIDRMLKYAFSVKACAVFRITGDNPFTDPDLMEKMIDMLQKHNLEYVRANGLPFGITAELFSTKYLWKLYLGMEDTYISEYLTWFVLNDSCVKRGCFDYQGKQNLERVDLSIDYMEDLEQCYCVLEKINKKIFSEITLKDIISACDGLSRLDKNIKLPNGTKILLSKYLDMHKTADYVVREKLP